jgi:lipoprotein-anchoring transpeptidase ErfK/SrfK
MTSRILAVLLLAIGVTASAGNATAQIFQPAPPPAMMPPGDLIDDDDDDVVPVGPGVQSQPLAPLPGSAAAAPLYPAPQAPPFDPRDPRYSERQPGPAPIELTAPAAPSPGMPPAAIVRQMPPNGILRPPGNVDADQQPTASLPGSNLPPEYQPEVGQQKELPPNLRRQVVEYWTKEPVGTIIIDTPNTYLYLVTGEGKAIRYGIGVGREGFTWAGREKISRVAEWPDWFPPSEMIERQPYLPRFMAGGETNPLGARALYLGKTLYRIHGTNQPSTIGTFVSSGCVRLINEDVADLYQHVKVGTKVVVLPSKPPAVVAAPKSVPAAPRTASNPPAPAR